LEPRREFAGGATERRRSPAAGCRRPRLLQRNESTRLGMSEKPARQEIRQETQRVNRLFTLLAKCRGWDIGPRRFLPSSTRARRPGLPAQA
jgi:hypothetical protein